MYKTPEKNIWLIIYNTLIIKAVKLSVSEFGQI